jgi:hypothetical protein
MIRSHAADKHERRVNALQNDIRVVVAIHEADHVLMAKLHGIRCAIRLPSVKLRRNKLEIVAHAETTLTVKGASQAPRYPRSSCIWCNFSFAIKARFLFHSYNSVAGNQPVVSTFKTEAV